MREFPETELSWRLRANRGRRLRPDFEAHVENALGYRPAPGDYLDLPASDLLGKGLGTCLRSSRPSRIWPGAERSEVFTELSGLGQLMDDCSAYWSYFWDWEYLGALRVRAKDALLSAERLWSESMEPFCLLADELRDGLFVDYNDAGQLADADEFQLWAWGAFALGDL